MGQAKIQTINGFFIYFHLLPRVPHQAHPWSHPVLQPQRQNSIIKQFYQLCNDLFLKLQCIFMTFNRICFIPIVLSLKKKKESGVYSFLLCVVMIFLLVTR